MDTDPHQQEESRLRSRDIFSLLSPRPLWRLIRGMVQAPFDENFAGKPLAVCWFTNFSCNARCEFCCKAREIEAGRNEFPPLSLQGCKELLDRIRKSVDILYLSGGEPLIHRHILDILQYARELDFSAIGLSSNLINLDKHPQILDYLNAISVSIHHPEVTKHAEQLGVPVEAAQKAFDHLEILADYRRNKNLKVIVNCVLTESNLDIAVPMLDLARRYGFLLEVVPANDHGKPSASLKNNPEYIRVIDDLLSMRRQGKADHLAGSTAYYEALRTFEPFRCFPYGVPNIMPDGHLCTPCDIAEQYAVNIRDFPDLKSAVKASIPHMGPYPCRKGQCFKAGIFERSRLFNILGKG